MDIRARLARDRRLLDVIESITDVLPEDGYSFEWFGIQVWYYGENTKRDMAIAIRALRVVTGLSVTKEYTDHYFKAIVRLPDNGGEIQLVTARNAVCRMVETGEEITETVPDYSNVPTKTVTKKVTEWQCDPILTDA